MRISCILIAFFWSTFNASAKETKTFLINPGDIASTELQWIALSGHEQQFKVIVTLTRKRTLEWEIFCLDWKTPVPNTESFYTKFDILFDFGNEMVVEHYLNAEPKSNNRLIFGYSLDRKDYFSFDLSTKHLEDAIELMKKLLPYMERKRVEPGSGANRRSAVVPKSDSKPAGGTP